MRRRSGVSQWVAMFSWTRGGEASRWRDGGGGRGAVVDAGAAGGDAADAVRRGRCSRRREDMAVGCLGCLGMILDVCVGELFAGKKVISVCVCVWRDISNCQQLEAT